MFHRARITLTAWYLLSIMAVSITFSLIIFGLLTVELSRFSRMQRFHFERRFEPPMAPITDPDLLYETEHRIFLMLMAINVGIFGLGGFLSYFLAGKTLAPIQDMVEEQKDFVSNASHELRTPLTSLKSALEVHLRDKKLTLTEAKKLMADNLDEVNRLTLLANSLLDLSYFQKPATTLTFEVVNVAEIVTLANQRVEPLAQQKNITLVVNSSEAEIEASSNNLEHLLVILLDNAIKYSPTDSTITISITVYRRDIQISISDQGIGIDKEDLPHIFDRFFRSDKARSHTGHAGYGLGLSIALAIVEEHHGSLSVTSEVDQGSTFSIRLPKVQKRRLL
jgi:two-component system sensor histidine kinase CiaH